MTTDEMVAEIAALRRDQAALEQAIVMANDAAFGIAGIVCRFLVEEKLIDRAALADVVMARAGSADFNPALGAFARSLRMNLPGGRFELIAGGKSDPLDCA
jgi:hypothetical protein